MTTKPDTLTPQQAVAVDEAEEAQKQDASL
jgi:hypothetical protein